jgi:hypothetical protein
MKIISDLEQSEYKKGKYAPVYRYLLENSPALDFEIYNALSHESISDGIMDTTINGMKKDGLIRFTPSGIVLTDKATLFFTEPSAESEVGDSVEKSIQDEDLTADDDYAEKTEYPVTKMRSYDLTTDNPIRDAIQSLKGVNKLVISGYFSGLHPNDIAYINELDQRDVDGIIEDFIETIRYESRVYVGYFGYYLIPENLFMTMFSESIETYILLDTVCEPGKESPFFSVKSHPIPEIYIEKVYDFILEGVKGAGVPEIYDIIIPRILFLYSPNHMKYQHLWGVCRDALKWKDMHITVYPRTDCISQMKNVLFCPSGHSVARYISDGSIQNICSNLDLSTYSGTATDLSVIFEDNADFLKSNEIDDIADLSCFIIKYMPSYEYTVEGTILCYGITEEEQFEKMIGIVNVQDRKEFCEEYSSKFGISTKAVYDKLEFIFRSTDPSRPVSEIMDDHVMVDVRTLFEFDWYSESEVRGIFRDRYDMKYYSDRNMRVLGYVKDGDTYHLDKYDSTIQCIEKEFSNGNLKVSDEWFDSTTFTEILGNKEKSMEWVRISSSMVKSVGTFKFDFRSVWYEYLQTLMNYCKTDYITVQKLKNLNLGSPIEELGFGIEFYESLLKAQNKLNTTRMQRTTVYHAGSFTKENFIYHLVEINGKVLDIYDLTAILNDEYGIGVDVNAVKKIPLKRTTMFYDEDLERFYLNEKAYMEEDEL